MYTSFFLSFSFFNKLNDVEMKEAKEEERKSWLEFKSIYRQKGF